ncbi:hypothetical protein KMU_35610 [Proteus vulgaris]|uniref:hypothetical protein n=1 Tax=Proteus vulgaris TaxID=585 RepID=UPI002553FAFC|nr:hypothetical protein [Proteus vulgaris]GLX65519.1 hypothetical protein KMU_35610 [Proteus vulgaris]
MNIQHVVANDEFCSERYYERVDCAHKMNVDSSLNVVCLASIKEKRAYDEAKKRVAAIADMLDW